MVEKLPPLPSGFVLDEPQASKAQSALPPLPDGFTLDSSPAPAVPLAEGRSTLDAAGNVAAGMGERVLDLAGGAVRTGAAAVDAVRQGADYGVRKLAETFAEPGSPEALAAEKVSSELGKVGEARNAQAGRIAKSLETKSLGYEQMTSWDDFKASPVKQFIPFALETGLVSLPDMVAAMGALPVYVGARSGELGQQRAENNNMENATVGDILKVLPAATVSAMLDRLGGRGMFGLDEAAVQSLKQIPKEVGKAGAKEGLTEGAQEAVEYTGTNLGTEKGMDAGELGEQMAAGAVGGAGFGAGVRGVTAPVDYVRGDRPAAAVPAPMPARQPEQALPPLPDGFTMDQPDTVERALGGSAPVAPEGIVPEVSPAESITPPATNMPPELRATLRKMMWTDDQIDSMSPEEAMAEAEQAVQTVTPEDVAAAAKYAGGANATTRPEGNARDVQAPAVSDVVEYDGSVPQQPESSLPQLRGQGNNDLTRDDGLSRLSSGGRGSSDGQASVGPGGQQRPVRTGEPALGDQAPTGAQPAQEPFADRGRGDEANGGMGQRGGAGAINDPLSTIQGDGREVGGGDPATSGERDVLSTRRGLPSDASRGRPAEIETAQDLDVAGERVNTEPSDAQKDSGVYKKAHVKLGGFDISIETPKGVDRRGKNADGTEWTAKSPAHYGYIKGVAARSPDGEHVDVFVGDNPQSKKVYIVDQKAPSERGRFDEMKIIFGANSIAEARDIYVRAFSDGSGNQRLGAISSVTPKALRDLLASPTAARSAYRYGKIPTTPEGLPADSQGRIKRPPSLTEFLAANGGIRDHKGELDAMDAGKVFVPGIGKLLRPNGRTLDDARAMAVENGYLTDAEAGEMSTSTVDDLLVALRNDIGPRNHFSINDDEWAGAWQDQQARAVAEIKETNATQAAEAELESLGVEMDSEFGQAALRLMVEDGLPVDDALERAAMQDDAENDMEDDATPIVPFFDEVTNEVFPGAASQDGEGEGGPREGGEGPEAARPVEEVGEAAPPRGEGGQGEVRDAFDAAYDGALDDNFGKEQPQRTKKQVINDLRSYAKGVVGGDVQSVSLIGSLASVGQGKDIDLLYDLGSRQIESEQDVTDIVERTNLDLDSYDSFFKVGDRYFHLSAGAGREIVENTDYAKDQAGKPVEVLATAAKGQSSMFGEVTDKEKAQAKADAALKAKKPQQDVGGMFGDDKDQMDLVDELRKPASRADEREAETMVRALLANTSTQDAVGEAIDTIERRIASSKDGVVVDAIMYDKRTARLALAKLRSMIGAADKPATVASAAKSAAMGLDQVTKGLTELFGGAKLSSGPTFDEETYRKALPFFKAGVAHFKDAASDVAEMVKRLVRHLAQNGMDRAAVDNMRPYVRRFVEDVQAGKEKIGEVTTPEAKPAKASKPEIEPEVTTSNPEAKINTVLELLRDRLIGGDPFPTITQARKFLMDNGWTAKNEAVANKEAEELIEHAVVLAARDIIKGGKARGSDVVYDRLVGLYERQPRLATRTSTSMADQAYSTPMPLAYVVDRLVNVRGGKSVYEPTAGNGALLIDTDPASQDVRANELNPDRSAVLSSQGFKTTNKDAMEVADTGFDRIVANPPFGAVRENGESKVFQVGEHRTTAIDQAIALKALEAMTPDGKAAFIVGSVKEGDEKARSDGYSTSQKRKFYKRLYDNYNVTHHFTVAGSLYQKQGAAWPVDVIIIDGKGKSALPLPAARVPRLVNSWAELKGYLDGSRGSASEADADGQVPDAGGSEVSGPRVAEQRPVEGDRGGRGPDDGGRPAVSDARPDRDTEASSVPDVRGQRSPDGDLAGVGSIGDVGSRVDAGGNGQRVAAKPRDVRKQGDANATGQVPYRPYSREGTSLNTLVPQALGAAMDASLARIEEQHGDIDNYVANALGYKLSELKDVFSAEQIDAVALAINNVANGDAFVIGDQTGIGKGRVVAAAIRYAHKQGMVPVFVTEKPDLYGDMYRDLGDIQWSKALGREPRIFMTNSNTTVPLDDEAVEWVIERDEAKADGRAVPARRGQFTKSQTPAAAEKQMMGILDGSFTPDVVFTTYDQMNTVKGKETSRRRFMTQLAPKSFLIMDESHNAGGQGDPEKGRGPKDAPVPRSVKFREWLGKAKSVMYSSATYAKNPTVMDLYSRTDMAKAVDDPKDLPELIAKGKVPLQQVVASMLAQSGQYARRERSFEGVEYGLDVAPVDQEAYASFAGSIRAIFNFDRAIKDFRKEWIEGWLKENGAGMGQDGGIGDIAANSTEFASIMHNIVNQMLLAIKADAAADGALAALKAGEKPVITLSFTSESFLADYVDEKGLVTGDEINISFKDVVHRYLARTLRITIKNADDTKSHVFIPVDELPPEFASMYEEAMAAVDEAQVESLPVSPIDWIRNRIQQAGYSVAEITGRSMMIDYGDPKSMRLADRPSTEQKATGKRVSIKKYNDGALDALILNKSGSTGVSLHASNKYKDQRRRRMIIAQADGNIDTHMQMLGRVHRTGQVIAPAYTQLTADIPAEARPTAVLMKKMASLSANTTASRKSAFSSDAVDFMNEYGDLAAVQWAKDNPETNSYLNAISFDDKGRVQTENPMQKLTGRIMLLDVDAQVDMLDNLTEAYKAILAQKEALGENALEAKVLDLQAEPIESHVIKPAIGPSPFQAAANLETMRVKAPGRAMKPKDVVDAVANALEKRPSTMEFQRALPELQRYGADKAERTMDRMRTEHMEWQKWTVGGIKDPKAKEAALAKATEQFTKWAGLTRLLAPGAHVTLQTGAGDVDTRQIAAIVLSVKQSGKAKSPTAASAWTVTFALPDSMRMLSVPFSQLSQRSDDGDATMIVAPPNWQDRSLANVEKQFEAAATEGKEERVIATGNVLAAFDHLEGKGQIIQFTDADGNVRPGIMMPRGFTQSSFKDMSRTRFATAHQVIQFLKESDTKEVEDTKGLLTITNTYKGVMFTADAGRGKGGRYFTDAAVRKIHDDWIKERGQMVATVDLPKALLLIEEMQKIGAKFIAPAEQELAQGIVYPKAVQYQAMEPRGTHEAPDADTGSPIYDVTSNGTYPSDFYSSDAARLYSSGSELDQGAVDKIKEFRGKPDALVKVWRAIPWSGKGKSPGSRGASAMRHGDWVTIRRQYAIDHGENELGGNYELVAVNVRAKDLFTNGDSLLEWGWFPSDQRINASTVEAPAGWGAAGEMEVPTLTPEDQQEVANIVARVSGLPEVHFKDIILFPRNTETLAAWGERGQGEAEAAGMYQSTTATDTGKFIKGVVTVSMRAPGAGRQTAYHEAFHHVQRVLMTDAEHAVLVREKQMLVDIVALKRVDPERMSQVELEADAFAIFADALDGGGTFNFRLHIGIRKAWLRIYRVIRAVGNFLRGKGYQSTARSAEEVFLDAYEGKTATRKPKEFATGEAFYAPKDDGGLSDRVDAFRNYLSQRTWSNIEKARDDIRYYIDKWNKPDVIFNKTPIQMPHSIIDDLIVKRGGGFAVSQKGTQKRAEFDASPDPIGDAPKGDWGASDMQDYRKDAREGETVSNLYVSLNSIPNERLAGGATAYAWEELQRHRRGSPIPPVTLRLNKNGSVSIIDGNHRIRYFREQGYDSVPAYVISREGDSRIKVEEEFSVMDERVPSVPPRAITSALVTRRLNRSLTAGVAAMKGLSPKDKKHKTDGEGAGDYLHRKMIDYLHPLRRMQESVGANLTELNDAYMNARLMEDQALAQIQTMHDKYVRPMVDALARGGATLEEFHKYLYALHAEERNRVVGARNPRDTDLFKAIEDPSIVGASGMSTNQAREIMETMRQDVPKFREIRIAAGHMRAMLDNELKNQRRAGLISDETYDLLTTQWRNYVPLKGMDGQDEEGFWKPGGSGFDVRGSEFKTALGRFTEAENVIAHSITQNEQSILRQHKNTVGKAMLRFINEFDPEGEELAQVYWAGPDGLGDIVKAKDVYKRKIGSDGQVKYYRVPNPFSNRDDVLAAKLGGKTYYIRFADQKVGLALRKMGQAELGSLMKIIRPITVWQSIVNTRANPAFTPINIIRDIQTGGVHLLDEGFSGRQIGEVMRNIPKAMGALWRTSRGRPGEGEWDRYAREYIESGGKITFHGYSDLDENLRKLQKQVIRATEGQSHARTAWEAVTKFVGDLNDAGENGIRLAAYVSARKDQGRTPREAAFMARDLTVDFKKRGEVGPAANSLYVFFNAAIQGNYNIVSRAAHSRLVRGAVAGFVFSGVMQHIWNSMFAGDDDDGENFYKKMLNNEPWKLERQFVFFIPNSGGKYVSFPMPYGYNAFHHLGVQGAAITAGDVKPTVGLLNALRTAFDAFNPIGSGSLASMVTPTVADPAVDILANENFAGAPIYPDENPFDRSPDPESSRSFTNTAPAFKHLAWFANWMTGGSSVEPGAVDVHPDTLEHLWGYLSGGLGRFATDIGTTANNAVQGEWEPRRVPWVKSFYGEIDETSHRTEYFKKREAVLAAEGYQKSYYETGDTERARRFADRNAVDLAAVPAFKAAEKQRRRINKERRRIEASDMPSAERALALTQLDKQEQEVMKMARTAYVQAEQRGE